MTVERQFRILFAHACAVIRDADAASARSPDVDRDLRRARVQAVFNQLFENARGAFNDLPGGDQADELFWKLWI